MLFRIQSTALVQSGDQLRILKGATITVLNSTGALSVLYSDGAGTMPIPNPTAAEPGTGGYDFYVGPSDYYDIIITDGNRTVDKRVYPPSVFAGQNVVSGGIAVAPYLLVTDGQSDVDSLQAAQVGGDLTVDPNVFFWTGSVWVVMDPANGVGVKVAGRNSISFQAAKELSRQGVPEIYVVNLGHAGNAIEQWMGDGTDSVRYVTLKSTVEAALASSEMVALGKTAIDGFIWAQGGSNNNDTVAEYRAKFETLFFTQLQAETWFSPRTPVALQDLGMATGFNKMDAFYTQAAMAEYPYMLVHHTDDLARDFPGDGGNHQTGEDMNESGRRAAQNLMIPRPALQMVDKSIVYENFTFWGDTFLGSGFGFYFDQETGQARMSGYNGSVGNSDQNYFFIDYETPDANRMGVQVATAFDVKGGPMSVEDSIFVNDVKRIGALGYYRLGEYPQTDFLDVASDINTADEKNRGSMLANTTQNSITMAVGNADISDHFEFTPSFKITPGGVRERIVALDQNGLASFDTREEFVIWDGTLGSSAPDGAVVFAGGLSYIASAGATDIADLPGWVPLDVVYLEHFGATGGNKVVDDPAGTAAMAYLASIGGGVLQLMPGKTYIKDDAVGSAWLVPSNTTIKGAPGASIFFDDDPAIAWDGANRVFGIFNTENVTFDGVKITSTLSSTNLATTGKQAVGGLYNTNLKVTNCIFENIRNTAWSFGQCDTVTASFNTLKNVLRDGLRHTHSRNVHAVFNKLTNVGDDAISLHSVDSPLSASEYLIPVGHVIHGNIFDGCAGNIRALGAKGISITGNTIRRSSRTPIDVQEGWSSLEGNSPMFAIVIADNIILDPLWLIAPLDGVLGCIKVVSAARADLGTDDFANVNTEPYVYSYGNDTDTTGTPIGSSSVKITGNIISRTLPSVARYSDWGYGPYPDQTFDTPDFFSDPPITDDDFAEVGIWIKGPVSDMQIHANTIKGLADGCSPILIEQSSAPTSQEITGSIKFNTIMDCPGYGIEIVCSTADVHLDIMENDFNLDPFFRDSTHNADNTWANTGGVRAVNANISSGLVRIERNKCMHLAQVCNLGNTTVTLRENIVYADPAGYGNNAGNKGVRVLDAWAIMVHYDADPTSATFGKVLTFPVRNSETKPTTGTYLQGHVVNKNVFTVVSGTPNYVVTGWARLTTGSGHVAGTDWAELRSVTA